MMSSKSLKSARQRMTFFFYCSLLLSVFHTNSIYPKFKLHSLERNSIYAALFIILFHCDLLSKILLLLP